MCVGSRDPYWKEEKGGKIFFDKLLEIRGINSYNQGDLIEGPILSFFSNSHFSLKPSESDRVYLLSTAEGGKVFEATINGGNETAKKLEELYDLKKENIYHWPISGVDPTKLGEIMYAMKEKVFRIIEENGNVRYIVNTSPGTPQMKTAWYLLVNSGVLRADLYRTIEKTSDVEKIDITPLFEEELKNIAIKLIESFSFKDASVILDELSKKTVDPKRKTHCEIFRDIFEVYSYWMVFQYKEALEKIKKLLNNPILEGQDFQRIKEILNKQENSLKELAQNRNLPKLRAIDLYHNAELKFKNGDYVNSIWLYKECCEAILVDYTTIVLEKIINQKINIRNFNVDTNQVPDYLRFLCNRYRGYRLEGSLASEILGIIEGRGQKLVLDSSLRKEIRNLNDKRNKVLHEGDKATDKNASKSQETALKVMKKYGKEALKSSVFSNEIEKNLYPLNSKHFLEIGNCAKIII